MILRMSLVGNDRFVLTPIDNILPRYHVTKIFLFPSSSSVSIDDTVDALRVGLEKTIHAFPLLAGTVQELQPVSDHQQRGRLYLSAPWQTMSDMLSIQDFSHDHALNFSCLRAQSFPVHVLDPAILLPQDKTTRPNAKSVMLVKVTKVRGGLIVAHSLSHGFMDGGGMVVIAKIWAAFCRGEDGTRYLTREVLDRSRLMQGTPGSEVADFPELTQISPSEILESAIAPPT